MSGVTAYVFSTRHGDSFNSKRDRPGPMLAEDFYDLEIFNFSLPRQGFHKWRDLGGPP